MTRREASDAPTMASARYEAPPWRAKSLKKKKKHYVLPSFNFRGKFYAKHAGFYVIMTNALFISSYYVDNKLIQFVRMKIN